MMMEGVMRGERERVCEKEGGSKKKRNERILKLCANKIRGHLHLRWDWVAGVAMVTFPRVSKRSALADSSWGKERARSREAERERGEVERERLMNGDTKLTKKKDSEEKTVEREERSAWQRTKSVARRRQRTTGDRTGKRMWTWDTGKEGQMQTQNETGHTAKPSIFNQHASWGMRLRRRDLIMDN